MSQNTKNGIFYNNSNIKDRVLVLNDRLKRHLSSEYEELTEKKDNLENDVIQMKVELEKKDKTLFPNQERKDDRRFFTPLNIEDHKNKEEDSKEKQLTSDINRLKQDIERMENRMSDITDFLKEMAFLNDYNKALSLRDNNEDSEGEMDQDKDQDAALDQENGDNDQDSSQDDHNYFKTHQIYPQMIRNLYDISDYYQNTYPSLEILIEYNDNNLELSSEDIMPVLRQLLINIEDAIETYGVSMILIQGNVSEELLNISLNYICDNKSFDTVQIIYNFVRTR